MSHADVRIELPMEKIREFCEKWRIKELYLFGSVTGGDFRPESDVDVMVEPEPDAHLSVLDAVRMQDQLQGLLQREIDLVFRRTILRSGNRKRRDSILGSARLIHAR